MRYFQKIGNAQTEQLLHAVMQRGDLWNKFTVRTEHPESIHRTVDDIVLRYNPFDKGDDFVSKVCAEIHCENYPPMAELPQVRSIIFGLMARVEGEHLGRSMLTRLKAGERILPHSDLIAPAQARFPDRIVPAQYYQRYQIALQSGPGCLFRCGDEQVYMAPGEVWWFDSRVEHEVINNSAVDRIHLIVDIHTSRFDYRPKT